MKRVLLATSFVIVGLSAPALADPVNLDPGQWTYTMTMTLPGSGMDPIMETESDCMEEWESQLEPDALAQEFAGGADCKATNVNQTANMVSFKLSCPGEVMDNSSITLTHQGSSFAMDGDVLIPNGQGGFLTADLKVIANRTGACIG